MILAKCRVSTHGNHLWARDKARCELCGYTKVQLALIGTLRLAGMVGESSRSQQKKPTRRSLRPPPAPPRSLAPPRRPAKEVRHERDEDGRS